MADLTVPIQNNQVPRVLAAFTNLANQSGIGPPVTVDQAWVEAYLKGHVRDIVREYERFVAHQKALDDAAATLPPDIT